MPLSIATQAINNVKQHKDKPPEHRVTQKGEDGLHGCHTQAYKQKCIHDNAEICNRNIEGNYTMTLKRVNFFERFFYRKFSRRNILGCMFCNPNCFLPLIALSNIPFFWVNDLPYILHPGDVKQFNLFLFASKS